MSWIRKFTMLGWALLLTVGVGCTSSEDTTEALGPSAEQQQPSFGLIGDLTGAVVGTLGDVTDLLTCSEQPYAVSTQSIGPNGGQIRFGTHVLTIPGNAVAGTVLITAEQMPGSTNSVRLSPHGLQFLKPAALTMSYENCAVVLLQKKIVYTTEKLKILEVLESFDFFNSKSVTAPIDHFSRYAVAY